MTREEVLYTESYQNILLYLASLPSYDYDKEEKEWDESKDANNVDNQTLNNDNIEEFLAWDKIEAVGGSFFVEDAIKAYKGE